uniref:Uncharacterized protein n=1 Tax=Glossina austeni TaxID=7395 RepID=A0A1A9VI06_GLOAU
MALDHQCSTASLLDITRPFHLTCNLCSNFKRLCRLKYCSMLVGTVEFYHFFDPLDEGKRLSSSADDLDRRSRVDHWRKNLVCSAHAVGHGDMARSVCKLYRHDAAATAAVVLVGLVTVSIVALVVCSYITKASVFCVKYSTRVDQVNTIAKFHLRLMGFTKNYYIMTEEL